MAVSTNSSLVDSVAVESLVLSLLSPSSSQSSLRRQQQAQRRLCWIRQQQFRGKLALTLCCGVAAAVTASFIPHPRNVWTVPR